MLRDLLKIIPSNMPTNTWFKNLRFYWPSPRFCPLIPKTWIVNQNHNEVRHEGISAFAPWTFTWTPGGLYTQLAICSRSPCSIAISTWPAGCYIYSSPPLQLSRKVVRTRSEHSSWSAHTLRYVRTHPGTIAERNLISAMFITFSCLRVFRRLVPWKPSKWH
jgi:hypothetical protein